MLFLPDYRLPLITLLRSFVRLKVLCLDRYPRHCALICSKSNGYQTIWIKWLMKKCWKQFTQVNLLFFCELSLLFWVKLFESLSKCGFWVGTWKKEIIITGYNRFAATYTFNTKIFTRLSLFRLTPATRLPSQSQKEDITEIVIIHLFLPLIFISGLSSLWQRGHSSNPSQILLLCQ